MPPPEAARKVFGRSAETACRYVSLLAERAVVRGLLGPREVPRIWDRHILNCAAVAELVPPRCELVDIGSGAGLPGIVLAMLLPGVRVVLLEPMLRRTAFLSECVSELGLGNVTVCRGRAEEMAGVIQADVATARAVAPLGRLAELAVRVVRPGGLILAMKGREADAELAGAGAVLRRLGVRGAEVVTAGHGIVEPPATVIRFLSGAGGAGW
jgi:16S rRNA (guanine527-N7)-methyltransferase